eukprot:7219873-Pyramimonas_sp.AAC.3
MSVVSAVMLPIPAVRLRANHHVPNKTAKQQIGLRVQCVTRQPLSTRERRGNQVQSSNEERSRYLLKRDAPAAGSESCNIEGPDLVHRLGVFLGTVAIGCGAGISVAMAVGFGGNEDLRDPVVRPTSCCRFVGLSVCAFELELLTRTGLLTCTGVLLVLNPTGALHCLWKRV